MVEVTLKLEDRQSDYEAALEEALVAMREDDMCYGDDIARIEEMLNAMKISGL